MSVLMKDMYTSLREWSDKMSIPRLPSRKKKRKKEKKVMVFDMLTFEVWKREVKWPISNRVDIVCTNGNGSLLL